MSASHEIKKQIGERVKAARELLGKPLVEVATLLGWSNYQTLSSIEKGEREVKASELSQLAKILGRSIEYLLYGERMPAAIRFSWRNKRDTEKVNYYEQLLKQRCAKYIRLEELTGETKPYHPYPITRDEITWAWVDRIASDWVRELGTRPALTLWRVMEENHGVKIFHADISDAGSAVSAIVDGNAAVLINSSDAPWRRNYDLAHELFHLLTWDVLPDEDECDDQNSKSLAEKYADAFASALLMPGDEVRREVLARKGDKDKKMSLLDFVAIANEFDVSTIALLWRLVNLNHLDKDEVLSYQESMAMKEQDRRSRIGKWSKPTEFSERFVRLGYEAMMKGKISRAKLASFMECPLPDLPRELGARGLSEEEDYSIEFSIT